MARGDRVEKFEIIEETLDAIALPVKPTAEGRRIDTAGASPECFPRPRGLLDDSKNPFRDTLVTELRARRDTAVTEHSYHRSFSRPSRHRDRTGSNLGRANSWPVGSCWERGAMLPNLGLRTST